MDECSLFTVQKLSENLARLTSGNQFCVAYSGGLDSHALLQALALLRKEIPHLSLRAVHINHQWSPHAAEWEQHAEKVCSDLNIPLVVHRLAVILQAGDSVEARMREARYAAFEELLMPEENLLTAHTEDDQAETVLLQLLRGAGIKGLSAMPAQKKMGVGFLLRPLLNVSRQELLQFVEIQKISWVEDESNRDQRFNRNYLRRVIIPQLRARWPEASRLISRSARHCAEGQKLLDELADQDLVNIQQGDALAIGPLLLLTSPRRNNALRRWIQCGGFRVPHKKHWEQIYRDVLLASPDAKPIFSWKGGEIRRLRNLLYLAALKTQRMKSKATSHF